MKSLRKFIVLKERSVWNHSEIQRISSHFVFSCRDGLSSAKWPQMLDPPCCKTRFARVLSLIFSRYCGPSCYAPSKSFFLLRNNIEEKLSSGGYRTRLGVPQREYCLSRLHGPLVQVFSTCLHETSRFPWRRQCSYFGGFQSKTGTLETPNPVKTKESGPVVLLLCSNYGKEERR